MASSTTRALKTRRKPSWLKKRFMVRPKMAEVSRTLKEFRLSTVCESARCPNKSECFGCGTATFMILGDSCTRYCSFCAVSKGFLGPPVPEEPALVAKAAKLLDLGYVIITSVTRDDLPDNGLSHFAETVALVRQALPHAGVEILTPDFAGVSNAAECISRCQPDVFNHNVETVPSLYKHIRPGADWERSLSLLREVHEAGLLTKSGMMLGLGETRKQMRDAMHALRKAGVSILVLGQYLQPKMENVPVVEYISPEKFSQYRDDAYSMGFRFVAAGPFVRSSYKAEEAYRYVMRQDA